MRHAQESHTRACAIHRRSDSRPRLCHPLDARHQRTAPAGLLARGSSLRMHLPKLAPSGGQIAYRRLPSILARRLQLQGQPWTEGRPPSHIPVLIPSRGTGAMFSPGKPGARAYHRFARGVRCDIPELPLGTAEEGPRCPRIPSSSRSPRTAALGRTRRSSRPLRMAGLSQRAVPSAGGSRPQCVVRRSGLERPLEPAVRSLRNRQAAMRPKSAIALY